MYYLLFCPCTFCIFCFLTKEEIGDKRKKIFFSHSNGGISFWYAFGDHFYVYVKKCYHPGAWQQLSAYTVRFLFWEAMMAAWI